jgi:hypothetical protein
MLNICIHIYLNVYIWIYSSSNTFQRICAIEIGKIPKGISSNEVYIIYDSKPILTFFSWVPLNCAGISGCGVNGFIKFYYFV